MPTGPVARKEVITQENLPAALERGDITQAEVDRIWGRTEFVSAQTPVETRMMLCKLMDAGIRLDEKDTMLLSIMLDFRALMTKDESKFAHLVAGTETIVKTLQNVNPLMEKLRRQEELIESMGYQLERAEAKIDRMMNAMADGQMTIKHEVLHGGDEEAEYLAETAAQAITETQSPIAEPTEETYDGNVGSAWDPKNPAKGPIKLPTPSEEYEKQSKEFRERILKHS